MEHRTCVYCPAPGAAAHGLPRPAYRRDRPGGLCLTLELLQAFLILLPLRPSRLTDSELAAIGALFRLAGAAEQKMALITNKNHFTSPRGKYITSSPVCIGGLFLKKQKFFIRILEVLPVNICLSRMRDVGRPPGL